MPGSYDDLVSEFLTRPGVALGRPLNSKALTVGGKIFAFQKNGDLILKLPAPRCRALVDEGSAVAFDRGQRRTLHEWVAVAPADPARWRALMAEAHAFVSGSAGGR